MNNYKPYAYLYKNLNSNPATLTSCFVVQVPENKSLSGPIINDSNGLITVTYNIQTDEHQPRARQEEYTNPLSWNGNATDVKIIIGDGNGANGGSSVISSNNAETT